MLSTDADRLIVPLTVALAAGLVTWMLVAAPTVMVWEFTGSALPAASNARYLTVVVLDTVNGEPRTYAVPLLGVGSLPSVV